MELQGARVLITGASRGIGEQLAYAFVEAGSKVVLVARSFDRIEALAAELGGHSYTLDLSSSEALDGFIDRVERDIGPIDVLVNNAGVEARDLVEDIDEDSIAELTTINLIAPQRMTRQVIGGMIERGRGHLVFTSSAAAMTPSPGAAPYCASKAGLTRFSETVRIELKGTGVGVTTLHLGPVDTEMWERITEARVFDAAQKRVRRLGLLTNVSAEKVAADTVHAVAAGKREVRHPKRLTASFAMASANTRFFEALLVGFTPRKHR